MLGFYRSGDTTDKDKYCALTQFEATSARLALPCWDEPELKAQFDITLIADEQLTALSNMNVVSTEPHPSNAGKKVKLIHYPTHICKSLKISWAVIVPKNFFFIFSSDQFSFANLFKNSSRFSYLTHFISFH